MPFCAHRCDYCAFATYADRDHLMTDYVDVRDPRDRVGARRRPAGRDLGLLRRRHAVATPAPSELLRILDAIPRTDDAEVTVECNPEDASLERLARLPRRAE